MVIDLLDPFKHDQLNRKPSAEILSKLIESIDEPFVLSIDAGWGHGKTTFLNMWAQDLRNFGFTCLVFNSWENDFVVDPLIPFISEISSAIEKTGGHGGAEKTTYALTKKLKEIGIQVAKRSLPVAAKLITAGVLSEDTFADAGKTASDAIGKAVEEKFTEFAATRASLATFKETLQSLLANLGKGPGKLPLIFIIDELDRCRPPFAVALLERLKHLFSVTGIVFVLAVDKPQLMSTVRAIYGQESDAIRYLRRLIDLDYKLPDPAPDAFAKFLMRHYGFDQGFPNLTRDAYADKQFLDTFVALSAVYGLRLRDQEHAFRILAIVWRTLSPGTNLNPFITALLVALKVGDPHSYTSLVQGDLCSDGILSAIRRHLAGQAFLEENYGMAFEAYVVIYTESDSFISHRRDTIMKEGQATGASPLSLKRASILGGVLGRDGSTGSRRGAFEKIVHRVQMTEPFLA